MVILGKLIPTSRTTEVDAVSDRITAEYDRSDWSSDAHLASIFSELKPASQKLTKSINRIKAGSVLKEKDELRDSVLRSVYYLILGFLHHPDETIRAAAQKVDVVFEHYGVNIAKESYATESSLIESMLEDFAAPEISAAIEVLPGLSQSIAELRTAQTNFEEAKVSYEEEKAEEETEQSATEVKKEVVSIINNKLVVYLRAMVQVDEVKYGAFTRTIGGIIEDNNIIVKKRRKNTEPEETISG